MLPHISIRGRQHLSGLRIQGGYVPEKHMAARRFTAERSCAFLMEKE